MRTLAPTLCRFVIADRSYHRFGLAHVIRESGFRVSEVFNEENVLLELGLLEMDVLLEVEGVGRGLADYFPDAFHLNSWRALVCVNGLGNQPTLVLARREGQDPSAAQAAYQEVASMLQSTVRRFHPSSCAETLPDMVSPLIASSSDTVNITPPGKASPPPLPAQLPPTLPPKLPAPSPRLAGEIAHDLNNFLTIVRGNCQLLQAANLDPAARMDLLREIHKAGEQAILLTQQLQDTEHAAPPAPETRDANEWLASIAGILRATLTNRHDLAILPFPAPCPVRLIPGQLERVLVNLAANARDAMPARGEVKISSSRVEIRPGMPLANDLAPGSYVLLTIADTGAGLDERSRSRLFQPQASTKVGGKGIGLSIVRNIVQEHAGHIAAINHPGLGATFHIYLPLAAHPSKEDCLMSADTPPEGSETVLLVEDESMVRSIFRRILQENGYFVLEAANGAEALFLAEQFTYPIQLLVTDLAMPRMNGIELAQELASLHPESKVLFLSGYSDGALPGEDTPDPAIAFLQKPFKSDTLLKKVREVLTRA